MLPVDLVQYNTQNTDTDVVVQLDLTFMNFIEWRGAVIRDGDATACGQCDQEDQASSPVAQGVCEQLPTINTQLGKIHFTPVHTNPHRAVSFMQTYKVYNIYTAQAQCTQVCL